MVAFSCRMGLSETRMGFRASEVSVNAIWMFCAPSGRRGMWRSILATSGVKWTLLRTYPGAMTAMP